MPLFSMFTKLDACQETVAIQAEKGEITAA